MFKDPLRILKIYKETISDGDGFRYSIYLAGCKHCCKGCHNQASWDVNAGSLLTAEWFEQIVEEINSNPLLDGITLSGGDPFYYPESLLQLLRELKLRTNKNIWCYTGYTYEQLLSKPDLKACLGYIDTLVDGRFEQDLFMPSLPFRGSENQRIIRVNKLIKELVVNEFITLSKVIEQ